MKRSPIRYYSPSHIVYNGRDPKKDADGHCIPSFSYRGEEAIVDICFLGITVLDAYRYEAAEEAVAVEPL